MSSFGLSQIFPLLQPYNRGTKRLMRVSVFLLVILVVVLCAMWWISMSPARGMANRVHPGMTAQEVLDSGSGWISCTIRAVPPKVVPDAPLRYIEITNTAASDVATNSSSFPEDRPTRRWPSRRQFSNDLEHRIKSSGTPWEARFIFTGMMNRSDFTVTFGPDAKVTKVSTLHMQPAKPDTDPLAR